MLQNLFKEDVYLQAKVTSVVSDSLWPLDCSPPGSSVHGILQARMLEWAAMPSFRGSSRPRDQNSWFLGLLHWQAGSSPLASPGNPFKEDGKREKKEQS